MGIVFNLSGYGHFDLYSYDKYLAGELEDYDLPQANIDKALWGIAGRACGVIFYVK